MGISHGISPLVFRAPVISQGEISSKIQKLQQGIREYKQDAEEFVSNLPPDAQAAFRDRLDLNIRELEKDLEKIIAANPNFSEVRYQINDLTTRFNGLRATYDGHKQDFAARRQEVRKSNHVFSATLQQATFSFPTSSGSKVYQAPLSVSFPTSSPAQKRVDVAKELWRSYAEKHPEGTQKKILKKIDIINPGPKLGDKMLAAALPYEFSSSAMVLP